MILQVGGTVLCGAVLCCAVLCCVALCCAVLCCAVRYGAVRCCAVLCCVALCCAVLRCAVLCYAVCGAVRYAVRCDVLRYNTPHNTILMSFSSPLRLSYTLLHLAPPDPYRQPVRGRLQQQPHSNDHQHGNRQHSRRQRLRKLYQIRRIRTVRSGEDTLSGGD